MAEETNGNLGSLHRRFDAVDARLAAHDAKLTAHDRQFEEIARRFDQVFQRFDALEAWLAARFNEITGHFDEVYRRLDRLEQEYLMIVEGMRRFEAMLLDEQGKRELLERRLAGLKTDVVALQARIEALERRLQQ